MKTILGQITEEFGELGKKIIKETAKVPGEIVMPKKPEQKKKEENTIPPRKWLEEKANRQEPSIFEMKNREEAQKKEAVKKQAQASAWQSLPNTGAATKRGDPRNIAKKQAGSETSRNARND